MLTVVSTSPELQESNVYLDKTLEITFSHEIHSDSLTTDNFKIYIMPGWTGQIAIKSITKVGPKVTIVTEYDLQPNQQYALWVRGDDNVNDIDKKGVSSVIDETMLGNSITPFTTGTKVTQDDIPDPEINVPAEDLETIDGPDPEIFDDDYLDVIGTFPEDESTNISGLTQVVFKFDQDITGFDISQGIVDPISGLINIQADHYIYGYEATDPVITAQDVSINNNYLVITLDESDLSENTKYTFTLHRDKVENRLNQNMPDDFEFTFGTKLTPLYTNADMVRLKGGSLIPDEISSDVINRYIHLASIEITDAMGKTDWLENPLPYKVILATTWRVICEIANALVLGDLRYIKEKRLADLKIVYNTDDVRQALRDACDEADNLLMEISPYKNGAQTGTKSGNTYKYPGAKRTVHRYNQRDMIIRRTQRGRW